MYERERRKRQEIRVKDKKERKTKRRAGPYSCTRESPYKSDKPHVT